MLIKYTLKYKRYKFIIYASNFFKAVEQIEKDLEENVKDRRINIVAAIRIN